MYFIIWVILLQTVYIVYTVTRGNSCTIHEHTPNERGMRPHPHRPPPTITRSKFANKQFTSSFYKRFTILLRKGDKKGSHENPVKTL